MIIGNQQVVLVNARVLIRLEKTDERTEAGLYLPQTAVDKAPVQTGRIVAVGPGMPLPIATHEDDEPWRESDSSAKFVPLQAQVGDRALFLREQAIDVKVEGEDYVVVSHNAVLMLMQDTDESSV